MALVTKHGLDRLFLKLKPFLENNTLQIGAYHYLDMMKPYVNSINTASDILRDFKKNGILDFEQRYAYDRTNEGRGGSKGHYYFADTTSLFADINSLYWKQKIIEIGLVKHIRSRNPHDPLLVYGAYAQGKASPQSILYIGQVKNYSSNALERFENKLGRPLVFSSKLPEDIHLQKTISLI